LCKPFSQLVASFSRGQFHNLVKKHGAERYSKGFGSGDHFIAMLFCQLAQAKSLREICCGPACTTGKLRHLGLTEAPTGPGRCFRTSATQPLIYAKPPLPRRKGSVSRTNCFLFFDANTELSGVHTELSGVLYVVTAGIQGIYWSSLRSRRSNVWLPRREAPKSQGRGSPYTERAECERAASGG